MNAEKRERIRNFIQIWSTRGNEKSETQEFWNTFLRDVLDIERPETLIMYEKSVKQKHQTFIDAWIPSTKVLIEQKGADVDLSKPQRQSDGEFCTPYEQALRYNNALPFTQKNKWIIVCNFREFHIYDMDKTEDNCLVVPLKELEANVGNLMCIVDKTRTEVYKETELSIKAGELVGKLYDALLQQYDHPSDPATLKSLNKLCVRLVFCLYAEDADMFVKDQFYNYLKNTPPEDVGAELADLFAVLNTPVDQRSVNLKPRLKAFPYVNGGLFQDEDVVIPPFTDDLKFVLLHDCSLGFDWSGISPTIFGAVFESTLNPETRRANGMHYTSIENIHKLIDALFLNDLKSELEDIFMEKVAKTRNARLREFHVKLANLTFFDPACGSGNFLTETYICLRKMENDIIRSMYGSEYRSLSSDVTPIMVSISNFYGIEINDFAVSVAKTALWIAESQAIRNTEAIIHADIQFLPLKSYANIVEGNALRIDWETVVPKDKLNYILGNPPFVGYTYQSKEQKEDLMGIDPELGKAIDYVSGWYFKAARLIEGTEIQCAFVSTNSITQGEQVCTVWKPLIERYGIHINFAYQTFRWDSESTQEAKVHCVIVGFSNKSSKQKEKFIFDNSGNMRVAKNVNPYLLDAPTIFLEKRKDPICNVSKVYKGSQPTDGGNLIISADEYDDFIKKEPLAQKYIREYLGSEEFINGKRRYCLWLVNVNPSELHKMPLVLKRLEAVKEMRLESQKESTRKWANYPSLFTENRQPNTDYITIPEVSSEKRRYIPIGFMHPDTIASNLLFVIPNATLYHFGVITSSVHMAWMRTVCGRLKSDYRYSNTIVYNNFPWCNPSESQRLRIEQTAQAILDARALSPDASLADLYDETTIPPELRKAHQNNDRAVMDAYGFPRNLSEMDVVARLMEMYQEAVGKRQ
ncbi:MAG: class I SAM-dependent DNA methyltransferase [Thermoguttaceae bacterium]|nr:class I SAM-dependent DNA methyltransferase [Thermoguttaceae bacterium]